jgi:hypothetical protein
MQVPTLKAIIGRLVARVKQQQGVIGVQAETIQLKVGQLAALVSSSSASEPADGATVCICVSSVACMRLWSDITPNAKVRLWSDIIPNASVVRYNALTDIFQGAACESTQVPKLKAIIGRLVTRVKQQKGIIGAQAETIDTKLRELADLDMKCKQLEQQVCFGRMTMYVPYMI